MHEPRQRLSDEAIRILKDARSLLEDPDKWCKGSFANNESGYPCPAINSEAVTWCAQGAVYAVSKTDTWDQRQAALRMLQIATGTFLTRWNDYDDTTHENVLALFDNAINIGECNE